MEKGKYRRTDQGAILVAKITGIHAEPFVGISRVMDRARKLGPTLAAFRKVLANPLKLQFVASEEHPYKQPRVIPPADFPFPTPPVFVVSPELLAVDNLLKVEAIARALLTYVAVPAEVQDYWIEFMRNAHRTQRRHSESNPRVEGLPEAVPDDFDDL